MPQSANNVGTIKPSRHFATRLNYGAYKIELSHYQYLIALTLVETAHSLQKNCNNCLMRKAKLYFCPLSCQKDKRNNTNTLFISGFLLRFLKVKSISLKSSIAQYLLVGLAIVMLLVFSGAFGTSYFPLMKRIAYWFISITLGYIIAILVGFALDKVKLLFNRPLAYHIIYIVIITLLIDACISLSTSYFTRKEFDFDNYIYLLIPVFTVSLFITIIHVLLYQKPMQSHGTDIKTNKRPEIYNRFEPKFRNAEIYAIKSEDHYLRFYTSGGEFLLLLRLYDAIKELEGIEGTQCHRSWWIAKAAVEKTENEYGKKYFALKNQIKAPISRSFVKSLKDMNWF